MQGKKGFTLVELVVVIMILGILAGVAAPKFLGTSADATENGLKQSLSTIRNAIEMFAAYNNGELPDSTDSDSFQADLADYLRGDFPSCPGGEQEQQCRLWHHRHAERHRGLAVQYRQRCVLPEHHRQRFGRRCVQHVLTTAGRWQRCPDASRSLASLPLQLALAAGPS